MKWNLEKASRKDLHFWHVVQTWQPVSYRYLSFVLQMCFRGIYYAVSFCVSKTISNKLMTEKSLEFSMLVIVNYSMECSLWAGLS